VATTFPASTPKKEEDKKYSLTFKPGMIARTLEDRYQNSKWAGATFEISGGTKISEMLSTRYGLALYMTSGSYTNQYTQAGSAPSTWLLDEAVVAADLTKWLKLEAGVMPNSFSSLPTNFDAATGFPGIKQTLTSEGTHHKATLYSFQGVPASDSRTVRITESGVTSTYFTVGASAQSNPKDRQRLTLSANVMRFEFGRLNSSAAQDSQFYGNTIVGLSSPQPRFRYGFQGYEGSMGAKYRLNSRFTLQAQGGYMVNTLAPDKLNTAYLYSGGVKTELTNGQSVTVSGGYFYNEPDTIPGSYASLGRSFNNRFGHHARIAYEHKPSQFATFVNYVRANEIFDKPFTADRDTITVALEVGYDIL